MLVMVSLIVRIDKYVIYIDDHTHIQQVMEDIIHQVLKGSRGISEAERHDSILKMAVSGPKGCFPFIPCSYS
jgi:hypothetical protein